jgi:NADPH:quinone reductase-like Zn-dependent oxidoreductase
LKAAVIPEKGDTLRYGEVSEPEVADNQVAVQLVTAAINRRDYWMTQGLYPGITYPAVPGSDGCGVLVGRKVIFNPNQHWGANQVYQSKQYRILGGHALGTFAERLVIDRDKVFPSPVHLTDEQAAALPLAGMTAYRALFTKARPKAGETMLVTGIGGGVALFALQFGLIAGLQVFVTSGSDEKLAKAQTLGATGGANYHQTDWLDQLNKSAGGVDIVIDGAGGESFSSYLKLCNPGARIVTYGGTQGAFPALSPQAIFWKQISIFGTTMASDAEFAAMIDFVSEHKIVPVVDSVFSLSDIASAMERIARSEQFGKVVLKIS